MESRKSRFYIPVFCVCFLTFFFPAAANPQTALDSPVLRSFDDLFPGLADEQKKEVFSEAGFIRSADKNEDLTLHPAAGSGIDLLGNIKGSRPSYLAESLKIVPYPAGKLLNKLDAYNALGRIQNLKGRLYHSFSRKAEVPLFEDAKRIESAESNNPIPDPKPASVLPPSETVFICLKDTNFGNSYYRADFTATAHGVIYNLTNFKNLSYLFFTVMKEGKFNAVLYLEALAEGMLVYSIAGADASDFVAGKVNIPSAISKRLDVFIGWVSDNLLKSL